MKRAIGHAEYRDLLDIFVGSVQQDLGNRVVSIVLYGSVARGTARPDSDVDLLLVLRETPREYWKRLQPLLPILRQLRKERCWKTLEEQGWTPFVSVLVLSLEEANENRYLYLDMLEEAKILVDKDNFFRAKLASLRQRLNELGAKKIQRNGDWYWDLKPDLKQGEVLIL